MTKKLVLAVIALLMAVTATVADEQRSEAPLAIAISSDFEPYAFLNAEGEPAGMFVDFWQLWAQKTGRPIKFIPSDWKSSLENLQNRTADIHSGLVYSPERHAWLGDIHSFYEVEFRLFYPVKAGKISSLGELSGQTVAVVRGTQPEQFLKSSYPAIRILSCDTREELVKATREGQARAFILITQVGSAVIDRMGVSGEFEMLDTVLFREKIGPGVLRSNAALLAVVDEGMNAISGEEWAEAEARWIPDPRQRKFTTPRFLRLTPAETAWLEDHKTIRVGMDPGFPPFKFSENGVIKGIEPDYLSLLSEATGIKFEYVVCSLTVMDAKVKSGEIDMFLSFNIPERLAYMTFTEPFLDSKQVFVTRSNFPFISGFGALKGKKVATVKGVKLYDKVLAPYPGIEVVPVDTMEQMFAAVSESRADALILRTHFVGYLLQNFPDLKINGIVEHPPEPYLYAVRKDYPELVGILNKAIQSIPTEKTDAMIQKWFNVQVKYRPDWSVVLKWSAAISSVFGLGLALTLFWNRRLASEIDKRIRAEEALQHSVSDLESARAILHRERDILQAVMDGAINSHLVYLDRDFNFVRVNETYARSCGYRPEEMLGRNHFALYPHAENEAIFTRVRDSGEPVEYHDKPFEFPDDPGRGVTYWDWTLTPVKDAAGQVAGLVFSLFETTWRKRAEQELRAKNDELERFTYTVSHDLKSPLITIQGYAGMIVQDLEAGEHASIRDDLQMIKNAAAKMNDLLNDLLELSRIGRQMNAPSRIDMNLLTNDTLVQLAGSVSQRLAEVVVQPDLPAVFGDQARIAEVVQNLIENAIKYMGEQPVPRIEIGFRQDGREDSFFVADNGAGIDPLYHEKIFNLFDKLDPASEGTGVGLALVKRIVELHGGRVWVESAGVGQGSCFCFTLPLASESPEGKAT